MPQPNGHAANGNTHPNATKRTSKARGRWSSAFVQAVELQRLTSDAAEAIAKDAVDLSLESDARARASSALAQLLKSWDTLEQRKRILRGLGNPKSVEARNAKPRRKVKAETIATEDAPAKESL